MVCGTSRGLQQFWKLVKEELSQQGMAEACLMQSAARPAAHRCFCDRLDSWERLWCSCCSASDRLARSLWTPVRSLRGPGSRLACSCCPWTVQQIQFEACFGCTGEVSDRVSIIPPLDRGSAWCLKSVDCLAAATAKARPAHAPQGHGKERLSSVDSMLATKVNG